MINIGITVQRLPLPTPTPVRPVTAGVVAFHGDSFAEGSSGGGSASAYNALQPTLRRYLLATGTGYRTVNHAVAGAATDAVLAAWRARSVHRRYNYISAGRNDTSRTPAEILANIDLILADRRADEVVILGSVHNRNDGSESPGSAAYAKWAAVNAGLAARADGVSVFFADHRSEAVYEHNTDWAEDRARAENDLPSASLVVSGGDALHLNAAGCEMQARVILRAILAHRALAEPPVNLLANPDFAGSSTEGWTASADTVLAAADGVVAVSGSGAFKGLSQPILAEGAAERRFYALWNIPALASGGGAGLSVRLRESEGGGAVYAAIEESYARSARGMFLAATPSAGGLALRFEAINNPALTFSLGAPAVYEAYAQDIVEYAPVNVVAPSLASVPSAGMAVTADPGAWDAYPEAGFSLRWKVGAAVVAEGVESYTPTEAQIGQALSIEVTATNDAGTATVSSATQLIQPRHALVSETFESLAGWTAGAGNAISLVNGRLRCANQGASWTRSFRSASIACEPGAAYRVSYDFLKTAHNGVLRIGWNPDGEDVRLPATETGIGLAHEFTAGTTAIHLSVACDSADTAAFCDWDNIVIEKL